MDINQQELNNQQELQSQQEELSSEKSAKPKKTQAEIDAEIVAKTLTPADMELVSVDKFSGQTKIKCRALMVYIYDIGEYSEIVHKALLHALKKKHDEYGYLPMTDVHQLASLCKKVLYGISLADPEKKDERLKKFTNDITPHVNQAVRMVNYSHTLREKWKRDSQQGNVVYVDKL